MFFGFSFYLLSSSFMQFGTFLVLRNIEKKRAAAPSKIQVAEKEKKFPRSEESCEKIFTGEKICIILIQDQERRRTGEARFGGALLIATGCRIAKMQDFPVADMIPAMVLVMPLSALWTNYIAPLL